MISISHLILIFILISLILFVVVIIQVNKLKYIGIIRSDNEVHQEIKNRLIRLIILFGLTITSGMIFIGLLVLFLTPLDENMLIKEGSQNYILAFIIVIIVVILGVVGTVGLVIMYNRKYSRKPSNTPFTERLIN